MLMPGRRYRRCAKRPVKRAWDRGLSLGDGWHKEGWEGRKPFHSPASCAGASANRVRPLRDADTRISRP
jgi:hypothetical protein